MRRGTTPTSTTTLPKENPSEKYREAVRKELNRDN